MPNLEDNGINDHELDNLLTKLSPPEPPAGLTTRIIAALPPRKPSWTKWFTAIFNVREYALPTGGALACLMMGLGIGYWPLSDTTLETEILIANVFGDDQWNTAIEVLTQ